MGESARKSDLLLKNTDHRSGLPGRLGKEASLHCDFRAVNLVLGSPERLHFQKDVLRKEKQD